MEKDAIREEIKEEVAKLLKEQGKNVDYNKMERLLDKHGISDDAYRDAFPEDKYVGQRVSQIYIEMLQNNTS